MTHLNTTQRNALILAGALSAFILVLIGAVASRVSQQAAMQPATPTVAAIPTVPATAGPDPAVQALLDQQSAGYKQVIQQANDQLAEANLKLEQAYAATAAAARPAAPPPPAYLSPDRAAQLAMVVAPGASVTRLPELVNFQGAAAYEVVLDAGTVYVDAVNGQVLFSGVAAAVASSGGGGGGGGGGGEYEDGDDDHGGGEHEEGDDDHGGGEHEREDDDG